MNLLCVPLCLLCGSLCNSYTELHRGGTESHRGKSNEHQYENLIFTSFKKQDNLSRDAACHVSTNLIT